MSNSINQRNTYTELKRIEFEHEEADKIVKSMRRKFLRKDKRTLNWIHTLREKGALNNRGAHGFTLLMHAVLTLCPKLIKVLIENGADPKISSEEGLTPVHVAAELDSSDCLRALLVKRDVANVKNDLHSLVPLDHAIAAEREENIRVLLERGADPNIQDNSGNTPLSGTITPTRFQYGRILLRHGADPFIKNRGNVSYIDYISSWIEKENILTNEGKKNLNKTINLLLNIYPECL